MKKKKKEKKILTTDAELCSRAMAVLNLDFLQTAVLDEGLRSAPP